MLGVDVVHHEHHEETGGTSVAKADGAEGGQSFTQEDDVEPRVAA